MKVTDLDKWVRVIARATITAVCLGLGIWLVIVERDESGYGFITFVAGYWLK